MSHRFFLTGGRHRRNAKGEEEWINFREAQLLLVDAATGTLEKRVNYVSPAAHRPDDPEANIVFKAGTRRGDRLYVCTQTEILTYSVPDLELLDCLSHPWFNDLHHVTVDDEGNFLVAVTGMDLVLEITPDGEIRREWPVLGDTWDRFDRETDYRRVLTTKPHRAHPNFVFRHEGNIWTTRFEQRDAVCLTDGSLRIGEQGEKLHDGLVVGDRVYFTRVDGYLVVAELATGRTIKVHDFNAMTDTDKTLGWCRGLHLLDDCRVVVGFSRIRPSRIRENLRFVKYHLGLSDSAGETGTRLACYDLENETLEWSMDLEKHGMNAVFSILPA